MTTYEQNMQSAMHNGYDETDNVWRFLAVCEARDETMVINTHLECTDAFLALCAESGIVTDRDEDALFALQQSLCSPDNAECDYGMEPVSGYDGELNDNYEMVCHTHN